MENRPSKSTPSVERMEIIDSTLTYDNIGELKAWADWATQEPREIIGEGYEGEYQRAVDYFEHRNKYYGIPLHFDTVDDLRYYFRTECYCANTDKIKDMKEYILFLPWSQVFRQHAEVGKRGMMLYDGLRALSVDDTAKHIGDYCQDVVSLWSSDRYTAMASYCPFSMSNAIITIG